MSILYLSKKAAAHMRKNLNFSDEEEDVIVYGFEYFFHSFFTFAVVYLTAWLFGCLSTALTAMLVASLLRVFSGGAHNESPLTCTLKCVVMYTLMGKASIIYGNQITTFANVAFVLAVLLISLRIIWVLAPVDSLAKPLTSESHRRQLRKLSLAAVVSISALQLALLKLNYTFFSQYTLAASLGVAWQAFTLTPAGHKSVSIIDDIFNKLKGGEKE